MNNSIKGINSKEITIQLKRAEVQKNILIENLYKEYEIYFKVVRKILLTSAEKGIFSLYSELSINDKELNSRELNTFLKKNISFLIHSKLPLITIEQFRAGDITDPHMKLVNVNDLKELAKSKEYQEVNFTYENELVANKLVANESLEFHCNNNQNECAYYENVSEELLSSVNLDAGSNLNSFSELESIKKLAYEKNIVNSLLELIEEKNENKLNDNENKDDKVSDVAISRDNLEFFEFIDKSFNNFLLNLSYNINSELFNINLIKKTLSESTFKFLSNNTYIIKHPYPFVIRYDLSIDNLIFDKNKSSDIYLFNISYVELEFYNSDLSNCRYNINEFKNNFRSLSKKQRYWKQKELFLNNQN